MLNTKNLFCYLVCILRARQTRNREFFIYLINPYLLIHVLNVKKKGQLPKPILGKLTYKLTTSQSKSQNKSLIVALKNKIKPIQIYF